MTVSPSDWIADAPPFEVGAFARRMAGMTQAERTAEVEATVRMIAAKHRQIVAESIAARAKLAESPEYRAHQLRQIAEQYEADRDLMRDWETDAEYFARVNRLGD